MKPEVRTPTPSGWIQVKILLRSNAKAQRKQIPVVLMKILVLPMLLCLYNIGSLITYSNADHSNSEVGERVEYPAITSIPCPSDVYLGGPSGSSLNDFVSLVQNFTNATVHNLGASNETVFRSVCTDKLAAAYGEVAGCIYVHDDLSSYGIYMNGSKTDSLMYDPGSPINSGITCFQEMMDKSIISSFGLPIPAISQYQILPTIRYENGLFWIVRWLPGLFLALAFMSMGQLLLNPMVAEQNNSTVEAFKSVGVRMWAYVCHWIIVNSVIMIFTAVATTAIIFLFRVVTLSSVLLVWLSIYLFFVHVCVLFAIVPNFIKNEELAAGFPFLFSVLSVALSALFIGFDTPLILQAVAAALNPIWGLIMFMSIYTEYDWNGRNSGVHFSNWISSGIFSSMVAQVFGIVMMLVWIFWYFGEYGSCKRKKKMSVGIDDLGSSIKEETIASEPLPADSEVVIKVSHLSKTFAKENVTTRAVDNLSMEICRNSIFGFLGHNGAGKTTTIKHLSCDLLPDSGSIEYRFEDGSVYAGQGNDRLIRSRIGVCPQHNMLINHLTCREILTLFAELKGDIPMENATQSIREAVRQEVERRLDDLQFTAELDKDKSVGTFSGGMKRKVSIAIALLGDPKIVFLDEPTAGMDPYSRRQIWNLILRAKTGRSIILTSHFLDEVEILSDRIGIVNRGRLLTAGSGMFLKHHFGTGYDLTYDCTPKQQVAINSKILQLLPKAEMAKRSKSDSVHTWTIPQGNESRFPKLLDELSKHHCQHVNLSVTTLEQVFLQFDESHFKTDGASDTVVDSSLVEKVWCKGDAQRSKLSWWRKTFIVASVVRRNSMRSKGAYAVNFVMPFMYLLGAFLLVKLASPNPKIVYPEDLYVSSSMIEMPDQNPIMFGIPNSNFSQPPLVFQKQVPQDLEAGIYVGGIVSENQTLMFNITTPLSLPVVLNTVTNYTLSGIGKSVSMYIGQLPYTPRFFDFVVMFAPMLFGFGTFGLAYSIIDVVLLKERQINELFHVVGIEPLMIYTGVAIYKLLMVFLPSLTCILVFGFSFANPIMGNGGRFLATILLLSSFAFAVIPFGMNLSPLFKNVESCKNWFPFIYMTATSIPYTVLITLAAVFPESTSMLNTVTDIICVIPPIAFQVGLNRILTPSREFSDPDLTWATIWSWENGLSYCIVIIIAVGIMEWGVLIYASRESVSNQFPDVSPVEPTAEDVIQERLHSLECTEGISIQDWVKRFKHPSKKKESVRGVNGISIGVKPNDIYALLGPNGSGKTTTMAGVTGSPSYVPNSGRVFLHGKCSDNGFRGMYVDGNIAYCPQFDALFPNLTVLEHCEFYIAARGFDPQGPTIKAHLDAVLELLNLEPHKHKMSTEISGGYQRKLCLAISLLGFPDAILVDEVTTGIDPGARHSVWSVLKPSLGAVDALDITVPPILLSTHYMDESIVLGTTIGIMINGEMMTAGTLNHLQDKYCKCNYLQVTFETVSNEQDLVRVLEEAGLEPTVYESYARQLKLQLNVESMANNILNIAKVFDIMESNKQKLQVKYYSVAEMSLEQIFINLSKEKFTQGNNS